MFGRRAGKAAAHFAKDAHPGHPSLEHVRRWQEGLQQAGLTGSRPTSPLLLPDYARSMPDYTDDATRLNLPAGRVKLA